MSEKIKIEIWSDVVCPFCYIGKRHLEKALERTDLQDKVELDWKSFELDPEAKPAPGETMADKLAGKYNTSPEKALQMMDSVSGRAAEAGLHYKLDKSLPANTYNAHRLIHMAAASGRQTEMKEALLKAYFTEGKDINDTETLIAIAVAAGLDKAEAIAVTGSEQYGYEVRTDEQEARQLGVSGVPFFVFNRRYAISGAQPVEVFEDTLRKVAEEQQAPVEIRPRG